MTLLSQSRDACLLLYVDTQHQEVYILQFSLTVREVIVARVFWWRRLDRWPTHVPKLLMHACYSCFLAFILHCDGCTQYPIHIGPVEGVSVASLPVCLPRLKISISVLESRLGWWVLISGLVVVSVFFPQPCTTSTPPRLHLSTSSPVHLRNSTRPTNALSQFF